jgi:hypothetical protein
MTKNILLAIKSSIFEIISEVFENEDFEKAMTQF